MAALASSACTSIWRTVLSPVRPSKRRGCVICHTVGENFPLARSQFSEFVRVGGTE